MNKHELRDLHKAKLAITIKKEKSEYEMALQNVRLEIQSLKTLDALKVRILLLTLIMEVKKTCS